MNKAKAIEAMLQTSIVILKGQNHVDGVEETTGFNVLENAFFHCLLDELTLHQRQHTLETLACAVGNGPAVCTCAEWPTPLRHMAVKLVTIATGLVPESWRRS